MKGPTVSELAPGQSVQSIFLVQSKDVRQKKTGEPYLSLTLMDRTGEIDAKMWDNVAVILSTFERDDFVRVKGETQLYQNRMQLTIHTLQRVQDADVQLADFLPASKRNPDEMFAELTAVIGSLKNPHLKALLESIFADPKVAADFRLAPAAKGIHHAWLGGLMEHVLSLCTLAEATAAHYPNVDRDLLMAGVILHDIGKISELAYTRSFSYTTEGGLLGHMQIAMRLVAAHLPQGFPEKLRNLVEHMILSHHGQLEYGSPKLPVFPEALLLHHLDNLDSKMEAMRVAIERDRSTPGDWTGYNAALERSMLDKEKYLNPPAKPEPAAGAKQGAARPGGTLMGEKMKALFGEGA